MPLLIQVKFEYTGWLGLLVGIVIIAGTIFATIKGGHFVWTTLLRRPWRWIVRWWHRRSLKQHVAFIKFRQDWLINHLKNTPEAILDEDGVCESVNDAMCRLLQRDSTELKGRQFKKVVGNSWEHETHYEDVRTIKVGGVQRTFRLQVEPFIFKGATRKMIVTLEPEVKMLNE